MQMGIYKYDGIGHCSARTGPSGLVRVWVFIFGNRGGNGNVRQNG